MSRGRPIVIDEEAFLADWEADLTIPELAERYGMARSTVSMKARALGCPHRRTGRRKTYSFDSQSSVNVLEDGEWVPDARGIMRWVASA